MKRFTMIGLALAVVLVGIASPAEAGVRQLYIAATDGWAYLPTDNTVEGQSAERRYYIRGFCDDAGVVVDPDTGIADPATGAQPGCATLPAPIIDVTQGDDVFIQLRNIDNLNPVSPKDPHTIHLHGMHVTSQNDGFPETSWEVPEHEGQNVGTYYFKAESPGTYMWHCHVEASEHVQMGMYGALVIRPKQMIESSVYGGQFNDRFDREYIILLSDVDTVAHDFIECGAEPDLCGFDYSFADFKADAWLVNGRAFPDTIGAIYTPDPSTCGAADSCNPEFSGPPSGFLTGSNNLASYDAVVTANVNERILLRVINLGYDAVPWHIHGWHFTIIGKDARPIKDKVQQTAFTINVGSGETYDLIIFADDRTDVGQYAAESNFYAAPNEIAEYLGSCPGGHPCDSSMDGVTDDYWFPMHTHDDFKVTNFGEYPGGQLAIIHVQAGLLP